MEIRQFREGDEYGVIDLFETVFGKKLPIEEWDWKYRQCPWGSASTVAIKDSMIIAHYAGLRLTFHHSKKAYKAFQICDAMTHPSYRALSLSRKGALVQTALHFKELFPMDFVFGFPNVRHAQLTQILLEVEKHRYVTTLSKPVSKHKGRRSLFLSTVQGWQNVKAQEIDSLWNEVRDDYALTIDKTGKYIFWRYRDCPTRKYELITFRSRLGKKLKAYAVVTVKDNTLLVLDFFHKKDFALKELFREIEEIAWLKNAETIKLWINPEEKIFHFFKSAGYEEDKDVPITCRIMNRDITLTTDLIFKQYSYRMGDYDAS